MTRCCRTGKGTGVDRGQAVAGELVVPGEYVPESMLYARPPGQIFDTD
jgi:hypothetical protein